MAQTVLVLTLQMGPEAQHWTRRWEGALSARSQLFAVGEGPQAPMLEVTERCGSVTYLGDAKLRDDIEYVRVRPYSFEPSRKEGFIAALREHGWRDDPLPASYTFLCMIARQPPATSDHPRRPQAEKNPARSAAEEMESV